MTIAITISTWINPPRVNLVTTPNNQRINKTTAIVYNIDVKLVNKRDSKLILRYILAFVTFGLM